MPEATTTVGPPAPGDTPSNDDLMTWLTNNPGLASALVGMFGTLVDPAQPNTTTETQLQNLPEYIRPYVERTLGKFEAFANEDYMPYSGPRVADFNQDQLDAMQRYRDMSPTNADQTRGTGIVGEAAQGLLDQAKLRWDQSQADHYMSPYMQSVVDKEKREAMRDFGEQMTKVNSGAVRAGGFGGDRHGIVEAEAYRNLNQHLGDIQTTGLQSAYTNAQGQFNADRTGAVGAYTGAANAGNTLAGIGQQAFQNQLATNQALMGIGNQQQGLTQTGLDIGYQNFTEQRDHPLKQAMIMQSGYQGLPMTNTTTANVGSTPSLAQQLISSGIGGYNIGSGSKP